MNIPRIGCIGVADRLRSCEYDNRVVLQSTIPPLRVLPGSHQETAPIHALLPDAHTHDAEGLVPTHAAMTNLGGQVAHSMKAGVAVPIDYRPLHGTHANSSGVRRECIIINFTPSWQNLPEDIGAQQIRHPGTSVSEREGAIRAESGLCLLSRDTDSADRQIAPYRQSPAFFQPVDLHEGVFQSRYTRPK
jgi:ectoine hydroxylase-related dioxygenase (phytanoyl-CoA dioxygenase family)